MFDVLMPFVGYDNVSVNYLLDEFTTLMLAEFDLKTQFKVRAERGKNQTERGLALLNKAKGEINV